MRPGSGRRRLRLRRKRKDEILGSKPWDVGNARPERSARSYDPISAADGVEVVGEFGCCIVEAIGSAAVLLALLTVPAFILMR